MIGAYEVSKMIKNVDDDEKLIGTTFLSGQNRDVWFLTEFGLYEVLMQSRKPIAKEFKKRVKVILKEIRLKGYYAPQPQFKLPQTKAEALRELADQVEVNEKLEAENEELKTVVTIQAPKVEALDAITGNTDKLYTITQIATNYGMTAVKMNNLLHKMGVQYKQSGIWKLYAKYEGNGYTVTPTGQTDDGYTFKNMKWTNKGEYFLYQLLKEEGHTSTTYDLMFKEQDNL